MYIALHKTSLQRLALSSVRVTHCNPEFGVATKSLELRRIQKCSATVVRVPGIHVHTTTWCTTMYSSTYVLLIVHSPQSTIVFVVLVVFDVFVPLATARDRAVGLVARRCNRRRVQPTQKRYVQYVMYLSFPPYKYCHLLLLPVVAYWTSRKINIR